MKQTQPRTDPLRTTQQAAATTLGWILERLVRLAMALGVTYPAMETLLKRSYIRCATHGFLLDDKPQTDSRITLLTGLNRADLRRLRAAALGDEAVPRSLAARVASRWTQPPFIDRRGDRDRLPRLASVGGERSFEALVQAVSTDIRAAALLAEWLATGVVEMGADDLVTFDAVNYYRLGDDLEERLLNVAYTAGDLINGYAELLSNTPRHPMSMRFCWLHGLRPESVEKLRALADGMLEADMEINRVGSALEIEDRGHPDAHYRFTYCGFRYEGDTRLDPPVSVGG